MRLIPAIPECIDDIPQGSRKITVFQSLSLGDRPEKPLLELRSRSTTDSALPINVYVRCSAI